MSSERIDKHSSTVLVESKDRLMKSILQTVGAIRFGSVKIVIHEGQVVQLERREQVRWDETNGSHAG